MNWILLRGLSREARHWHDFTELMQQKAQGQILTLDLPGFGTEKNRNCPVTIKANTEDIRERWLQAKENFESTEWGLLGISMGGMIALDWAHRYPYDFKRLVVLNSSSKDTGGALQRFSLYGWFQTFMSLIKKGQHAESEKEILKMVSNLRQNDPQVLEAFAQISKESNITMGKIICQLMASSQFMLPPTVKVPTLILASIKDHLVDVRCSKLMAERLQAQIKFHPTAGHDLTLDDPQWCVDRIFEVEPSSSAT